LNPQGERVCTIDVKSRTRLLLENKKQNTFVFENNVESTRVPYIHKGS